MKLRKYFQMINLCKLGQHLGVQIMWITLLVPLFYWNIWVKKTRNSPVTSSANFGMTLSLQMGFTWGHSSLCARGKTRKTSIILSCFSIWCQFAASDIMAKFLQSRFSNLVPYGKTYLGVVGPKLAIGVVLFI